MSLSSSTADRVGTLIEVVERDRERRIRTIRAEAEAEAEALVRRAREKAHERVRRAIRTAGEREQQRLENVRAELATRGRKLDHQNAIELLERAWARLPEILARRWSDAECRRRWVESLVELAAGELPHVSWKIEHPGDFDPECLVAPIEQATGRRPTFSACSEIGSGLRVRVGGVLLDGTERGLLARPEEVRSKLLGILMRARDENLARGSRP